MKTLIAFLFAMTMCSLTQAQDPARDTPLPGEDTESEIEKPVTLMPETAPTISKQESGQSTEADEQKLLQSKTIKSEADLQERIRLRKAKTVAIQDRAVVDEQLRMATARTAPEKRAAIREYYNRLYDRILKIDPTLKEIVEKRKAAEIGVLTQSRIETPGVNDQQEAAARAAEAEQ